MDTSLSRKIINKRPCSTTFQLQNTVTVMLNVPTVQSVYDLGVILNDNLNLDFSSHISAVPGKANSKLGYV